MLYGKQLFLQQIIFRGILLSALRHQVTKVVLWNVVLRIPKHRYIQKCNSLLAMAMGCNCRGSCSATASHCCLKFPIYNYKLLFVCLTTSPCLNLMCFFSCQTSPWCFTMFWSKRDTFLVYYVSNNTGLAGLIGKNNRCDWGEDDTTQSILLYNFKKKSAIHKMLLLWNIFCNSRSISVVFVYGFTGIYKAGHTSFLTFMQADERWKRLVL